MNGSARDGDCRRPPRRSVTGLRAAAVALALGGLPVAAWAQGSSPAPAAAPSFTLGGGLPVSEPVRAAVSNLLAEHKRSLAFGEIKSCYAAAGDDRTRNAVCRSTLNSFVEQSLLDKPDTFRDLNHLDVYVRLFDLAGDPERQGFGSMIRGLGDVIVTREKAWELMDVRRCFLDAAMQSAMRQICRQRLDRFHRDLGRDRDDPLAAVNAEKVYDRLLSAVTRPATGTIAMPTGMTAFNQLRKLREDRQAQALAKAQAIARARRYYCPYQASRRNESFTVALQKTGVCLCAYGRRFLGSSSSQRGHPLRAIYNRCAAAARFRVTDLNGGYLMHGDWVVFRAAHNGIVTAHPSGFAYAAGQRVVRSAKFRILRQNGRAGAIQPGDLVTVSTAEGAYISPRVRKDGMVETRVRELEHYDYFVFTLH